MNPLDTNRLRPIAPDTAILCILVVVGPQLFGGAFPWSVVLIAGLSLLGLATALWVRRSSPPPLIDGVFVVMGVAWLWTCVQAISLPSGVAHALRVGSAQTADRLEGLVWAGNIPLTISCDPGSTQLQILVGIAILAAFLTARFSGPDGLGPIATATVLSALLLGLEGLVHRISGADAVFGMYAPRFTQPQLLTPLMNGNHLGGFAAMGALLAAGLAARRGSPSRRAWAIASALCAITVAWTLSRGAIGSLLFGFVLLAAWLRRGGRSDRRGALIPVAVLGSAVAGTLAFAGLEPILRRFEDQGFDKLAVAARGFRLLDGSTWWLGVGRGAFSSTFVAKEGSLARYTHPENILVQWTTEWGLPIGLALLAVLIPTLWKRLREAEEPLVAAVCIAIFALSLQNLVDFSLEMAGVVVVVAALLGTLLPVSGTSRSERSLRLSVAALVAFTVILLALAPRALESDTQSIVDRLTRAMRSDDEAGFQSALRQGLALHPGEPAIALLAGTYAGSKGYSDAPRWLSIVMEEAPGWGAPHAVAARWLLARGRFDQGLLEIREAEERHPGSAREVLCELISRFPQMEHIERSAPGGDLRISYLNRVTTCRMLSAELRAEIDAAILQTEPAHGAAVLREARRLSSQKRSADAKALLAQALEHHPDDVGLRAAMIRAHLRGGDVEAAQSALNEARSRGLHSRTLVRAQARVEAASGQTDQMRATITQLRGQSRGDARLVAGSFMLEGELEASLGNINEALAAYAAADVAKPDTPALRHAADLALRSERPTRAQRLYRALCARHPGGSACAQEARLAKEARKGPPGRPMP
ncbi:MAG: tetratricopeptide repeat protein [Deltaproteobacteria bacterium]|nr:tetratricopeptide repeat protein [Deltaproteobacteria bacterium]MBW1903701.1 tetratricopeptide repeat protein [Deltaproteobacteria bacterium]MBW2158816.1 tetratricopeptide repeat protein [Deltaproteobacteria bacterium]MBW2378371.1 tetratricopeptide repeat protein [Deltaproteobacteria bacterium]